MYNYIFSSNTYFKHFKHKGLLNEFYQKQPYTQHPDPIINIYN